MTDHVISKIDAARRQLECAARLYFNNGDAISIHTLSTAARNVLMDLCAHRGITSEIFREELIQAYVKPEYVATVRERYRLAENFFKHADRDPEGTLSFNPEYSEYTMFEASEAYAKLSGESTATMLTYRTWWLCNNKYMHATLPKEAQEVFAQFPYRADQRLLFYNEVLPKWGTGAR